MDMCFSVFDVLEIAEEVEHKAARFCLKAAERFADWQRRNVYYNLASWRAKHRQAWARIRREYSEKTGDLGTFDPDNYVVSNPQVMAGLSCFGTETNSHGQPTGRETRSQIVRDTIRRSEGVVIFYHGLKEFACDPASRGMIDHMIDEENRHVRLLNRLLDRMQGPAEEYAGPALAHRAGGTGVHASIGPHALGQN